MFLHLLFFQEVSWFVLCNSYVTPPFYRTYVCFKYTTGLFRFQGVYFNIFIFIPPSINYTRGFGISHMFRRNRPVCRTLIQFYLYSDSNKSVICTFSAFASSSMLSSVGECFSFIISLIVDLGIPDIIESCRTEMFLLYMISSNNIFMFLFFAKSFLLYRIFISYKLRSFLTKRNL